MIESSSRHLRLKEIWPGLLFSVLIHTALAALLVFTPSVNTSMQRRCMEVQFVTLLGNGLQTGGNPGSESDAPSPGTAGNEQEPAGVDSDASGPRPDITHADKLTQPRIVPGVKRKIESKSTAAKPMARPEPVRSRKHASSAETSRRPVIREPGLERERVQKETGLPGQLASRTEGSGMGAAANPGEGEGGAAVSRGVGPGATL